MKAIPLKPSTQLGWVAVGLAVAFLVLMPMWRFMGPLGAWPAFICGFASGGVGLVAIIRQHERSWLVYPAILPLVFVVIFFVNEVCFCII